MTDFFNDNIVENVPINDNISKLSLNGATIFAVSSSLEISGTFDIGIDDEYLDPIKLKDNIYTMLVNTINNQQLNKMK